MKNAIRFGYKKDDNEFFLRAENDTKRVLKNFDFGNLDSYFIKFTFDYVRKVDNLTKLGL